MELEPIKDKSRAQTPALVMPGAFLEMVAEETLAHTDIETGGFIFGLRDEKAIYTVGSFTSPDSREVSRSAGHFSMGGENSVDFYDWQKLHWPSHFSKFLSQFNFPYLPSLPSHKLHILGLWHRHPGTMIGYSSMDDSEVNKKLDMGVEDFLFPIVTVRQARAGFLPPPLRPGVHRIKVNTTTALEVVCYYRKRESRKTEIISPHILRSDFFPTLVPSPWYIESPGLFGKECSRFASMGYRITLENIIPKGQSEGEVWLMLEHKFLKEPLYIKTSTDFHKNGVIYLNFDDPKKARGYHVGMIIPRDKNLGIADWIQPLVGFHIAESEGML